MMWLLDLSAEDRETVIAHDIATVEDFLDARVSHEKAVAKIYAEWTQERIREFIVVSLRNRYAFLIKKRIQLERENAEARMNGVPFQIRRALIAKFTPLEACLTQTRQLGTEWAKKGSFAPLVASDIPLIQKNGMEWYLKFIFIPTL